MFDIRSVTAALAAEVIAPVALATPASALPPAVDQFAPGYPFVTFDPSTTDSWTQCSGGFVARNENGAPIMLTAGHCDAGGEVALRYRPTGNWQRLGSSLVNEYSDPYSTSKPDIGVVPLNNAEVPVSSLLLGRTPVHGAILPTVGQRLCKEGESFVCGTVTKVTSSKVFFDADNRRGDSGGPVYAENGDGSVTAVGIVSGMPDGCTPNPGAERSCGGTTVAELIAPWLQRWGLTI